MATNLCSCFRGLCFGRDEGGGGSQNYGLLQERSHEETWLVIKLKKLKEFSEVVAGPKWKNLIRKMGKICNPSKQSAAPAQFQYSPESYALNFAGDRDDGVLLHSFSTRFAPHAARPSQ